MADVAYAWVVDEDRIIIDEEFVGVQGNIQASLIIPYEKVFDMHVGERPEDAPFHGVRGVIAEEITSVVVVVVIVIVIVEHFVDKLVVGDEHVLQARKFVLQSRHPLVGEVV